MTLPLSRQHAIVAAILDHLVVAPCRRGYDKVDVGRFHAHLARLTHGHG